MTPLWNFEAFAAACAGEVHGGGGQPVTGISIDSRTIAPGEAFFAIKGDRFDGHDFVAKAFENGAGVAVVAADRLAGLGNIVGGKLVIAVDDPLKALQRLGVASRERSGAKVIAVTGSVGKTGTKEMLRTTLEPSGKVHASVASFNNHWGVPLTLARMPADCDFAVFEIGMNHPGEITPLVAMVHPHVVVITTVEPVHLAQFESVEEIARAKAEIFTGLVPGGAAVLNRDNPHFVFLHHLAVENGITRIVGFGEDDGAEVHLEKVVLHGGCSCVSATVFGVPVTYKIGVPGRHLVQNSLAVLASVQLVDADLAKAAVALANLQAPKGRGRRHTLTLRDGEATLIDESYNANPTSMRAAIELLHQTPVGEWGKRIAVLGDMLELGEGAEQFHKGLAEPIAAAGIDQVFCAGPLMETLWKTLPRSRRGAYSETSGRLEAILAGALAPGDVVMIKGSLGSRMGPLVDALLARYGSDPSEAGPEG
ncbi:MAG: UDP-N-acetylmuramoylalanyl-D-glutamyl-2, 6-diaminopimelate--D-alanyl-D-alanine ligase [Hyphomicrobiales bacterium]|nr:MAG: UDP-N-acetylmuramoylalanyl-D-glutamyl-2, 6-diaminopimelate--D-alanyl-D-alanine ligase [Hyphomicrobiales bacterium]